MRRHQVINQRLKLFGRWGQRRHRFGLILGQVRLQKPRQRLGQRLNLLGQIGNTLHTWPKWILK